MKIHKLKLTVLLSAVFALSSLNAGIRFKNIYQNDMVLQVGEENIVAGVSSPNSAIDVIVSAKSKDGKASVKNLRAKANKKGAWSVKIPSFPKRTILEISAKNENGETAAISNVVTGELWLGSETPVSYFV